MGNITVHLALVTTGALVLAGCGFADSRSPVPEFMRSRESAPPPLEQPPDVKYLVRGHLNQIFTTASAPHDVQVSPVRHDLRGPGWIACVRAELNSATGKPLGMQTYRITINEGVIFDRRRIEEDDACLTEMYEPI